MAQWRWQRGFPAFGLVSSMTRAKFGEPLQAEGNLSYLEFIAAVKMLWEESYPMYPIKATSNGDDAFTYWNPSAKDPVTDEVVRSVGKNRRNNNLWFRIKKVSYC